jgi:hypothetical protein
MTSRAVASATNDATPIMDNPSIGSFGELGAPVPQ